MTSQDTAIETIEVEEKPKSMLMFLLKLAVSLSILGYLIAQLDLDSLHKLENDVWGPFVLSMGVMLVCIYFMTLRWRYVLELIEPKRYGVAKLFNFYLIGSFFNMFIPGSLGGDVLRIYYLVKAYAISKTRAVVSVLIERVAGLFALTLILIVSLPFNETVREKLHIHTLESSLLVMGFVVGIVVAKALLAKKLRLGYVNILVILFFSILGQSGDIVISYLFSEYLHLGISIVQIMSIMPIVFIATVIPISLGGLGVREGVMTAGFALYGVAVPDAVLVSFLLYLTKLAVGFLGWFAYLKAGKVVYHRPVKGSK